jgi:hypothetical protein
MICCLGIRDRNVQAEIKVEINSQKIWVLMNKVGAAVSAWPVGVCILKTLDGQTSLVSRSDVMATYKSRRDGLCM